MTYLKKLSTKTKWIALFSLWVLHGVAAFVEFRAVTLLQGSSRHYFWVYAILLAWVVTNLMLIALVYKQTSLWLRGQDILLREKTKDYLLIAAAGSLFLRVSLWIFHGLLVYPLTEQVGGYIILLTPVFDLMGYVSLEIIILIFISNFPSNADYKKPFLKFVLEAIVVFIITGFVATIIFLTGLGVRSGYVGDWQRGLPAVPLLEWQIFLACIICLIVFFGESKKKFATIPYLDVWICIVIWLSASILWLSQPVIPNASALKPHEPNFEIYPFNDAQTYDEFAQSVLVGTGFGENKIPQRPLYVGFLVLDHLAVGQEYGNVIFFQTLVFAIFPVLLYLFGKEFFSRSIGISIALLAILRDYTSNFVSPFTGNLSYSKLYLSEIPTAIFLILFLLTAIHWIKAGFPLFPAFLLGGILGAAMLIRTQVIVALPIIILFGILDQPKNIKVLIKSALLMFVTLALVGSPWLWRNWRLTGDLIFDSPESQTINLAMRYSRVNGLDPDVMPFPGESNAAYNTRLTQMAERAISSNPGGAALAFSNAFLNHAVNNILLFPLRNDLHTINEIWIPTSAFWEQWEGTPNLTQSVLIVFYVFLFGLGVTIASMRNGWLGLLPLALNLAYNLWTSLALLSGQRFMLTMDWSIYLYYMIGLFTLLGGFIFMLNSGRIVLLEWIKENSAMKPVSPGSAAWHSYLIFGLLFLGVGLSLPVSEKFFPKRYAPLSQKELAAPLLSSPSLNQSGFNSTCMQKMEDANMLSFTQGRAIYPRYYVAGDGERFTDSVGYKVVNEGRLVFDLVGQANNLRYIFKTSKQPDFFPHASDVTLISSSKSGELWFVDVAKGGREKLYISDSFDASLCQQ